jgi:pimeloyl-ACP methyl ester carboxylesterase
MKPFLFHLIRLYFRMLSVISPAAAGAKAFKLFQRTRKLPFKKAEEVFYKNARHFRVVHPSENIHAYELGNVDGDLVLLVHGWESNAGSMSAIANTLAQQGYHVVALDLPAHGNSLLTHTNLRECTEALRALIYQLRPVKPFSVVSHSFGSAVTAMALAGSRYEIENWIMLTSPNKLIDVFDDFKKQIALGSNAYYELLQQTYLILKEPVEEVTVERKAVQVRYKNLTIIHDVHDKVLPFNNAVRLSKVLRNAELYKLKNAGHYRMLYNEGVLFKISRLFSKTNESKGTEKFEEFRVSELMSA